MTRICDELAVGFGWIEEARLERCAHALAVGGRVYLFDPFDADGVDERARALGEPAAVVQLLDRHERDCALVAARLGVPHLRVPRAGLPGKLLSVADVPGWREVAFWLPDEAVLLCGDAVGTASYYLAPGEPLAVHPFLRVRPPRALTALEPRHVLGGHGAGIHGEAAAPALATALATARRRMPRWLAAQARRTP